MKIDSTIIFYPEAEKEYLESVIWYENNLIGLGQKFINEIENIIERIVINPLIFPIKKGKLREAVVKKFSFVIVFEISEKYQKILVLSVYHTSRNPKKKYRKLKKHVS